MSRLDEVKGWVVAASACLLVAACGGGEANSDSPGDGDQERLCIPGSSVSCACPNGKTGAQVCLPSGDGFGECECVDDGTGGSGDGENDAGADDDASTGDDGGTIGDGGSKNDGGTDGGTDHGNDAGPDGGEPNDPCKGISSFGVCSTNNTVQFCSVPTGQGQPQLVTIQCSPLEECKVDGHGFARCQQLPGKCTPGASECVGSNQARFCNGVGEWETYSCPDCDHTPLGAVCSSGGLSTTTWSGNVTYEAKGPNAALTSWQSLGDFYAPAMLVVSYRYDAGTGKHQPIDAAITGEQGDFTVKIPTNPGPNDLVAVFALWPTEDGSGALFAVAEPDVPNGEWNVLQPIPAEDSQVWSWAWRADSLGAPGAHLHVGAADGSGAIWTYQWLRYVYGHAAALFDEAGPPVVVWMRPNTSWNCGACFLEEAAKVGSIGFDMQIWIPMTAQDESYWSDAVTAHELGHWMMSSYGRSPLEGGPHYLGCPTFPGQAWSEGFATWLSSMAREDSVYYDKQVGTFFWFDIGQREYGSGYPWQAPKPADGVLQQIDENEVAAMMWALADTSNPDPSLFAQPANQIFFDALKSPVVKKDWGEPYGRGYNRHIWDVQVGTCGKKNVVETTLPVPTFADYLDALRCEGMSAAAVDAVTKPATRYPYPSASPICN